MINRALEAPSAPFFIVGCPRSGTTLVRTILDAHPRLAIPAETLWIAAQAPRNLDRWRPRHLPDGSPRLRGRGERDLERILHYFTFADLGLDPDEVRRRAERGPSHDYPTLVSLILGMYAEHRGKPRWGDKTPRYVEHIPLLSRMFPTAQFVHVIRDGRHVAASMTSLGSRSGVSAAGFWSRLVRQGRRDGLALGPGRYLELRLEDLIAHPPEQVARLVGFLGESFAPEQLQYHAQMSQQQLPHHRRHLARPPTAGLRDWRAGFSQKEQRQIEALCEPVLRAFGYDTPIADRQTKLLARSARATDLLVRAPRYFIDRGLTMEGTLAEREKME